MDSRPAAGRLTPLNLWIIHGAFMASVPMYAGLLAIIRRAPEAESAVHPSTSPTAFVAVIAVSLAQVFLALWLPVLLESIETSAKGSAGGQSSDGSAAPDLSRRVRHLVVMDALMEAVAVYGLFGAMVGFLEIWQAWVVMGLAAMGLVSAIPRVRAWTR